MENLKNLYNTKLKYNCYVTNIKDLYIVYISTSDFIICSNFWGCEVIGQRNYNYNEDKIKINYIIKEYQHTISEYEAIIKKYEKLLSQENFKKLCINNLVED